MRLLLGLLLVVESACYDPALRDCTVVCAGATDCADGQICGVAGFCVAPDAVCAIPPLDRSDASVIVDANLADDAMPHDAATGPDAGVTPPPPGDAGTPPPVQRIIDCSASSSCQDEIVCRSGETCAITCGDGACRRITCQGDASCTIDCRGNNSCRERIECGSGSCSVTCRGNNACRDEIRCEDACACEIDCRGNNSCREEPECPAGCSAGGNACTADGSCDRC